MPPSNLTIDPPRQSSPPPSVAPTEQPASNIDTSTNPGVTSPVAPAFSPITPKSHTVFPATYPLPQDAPLGAFNSSDTTGQYAFNGQPIVPPAQYIPQPAPQPFSSEDSTDAIALRAAISTLQFQKKKAAEDIKALESIRKRALDDPELFRSELAAGRLKEQKPQIGDLRAILDASDSDEGTDAEEEDAVLGASAEDETEYKSQIPTESSDAQQTYPHSSSRNADTAPFDSIPGPQDVVRMPYINWEKYHIHGEAFDRMHEQQRRWPGSFDYGQERGREFAVAAPYSPWLDSVGGEGQAEYRKDSLATFGSGVMVTPTTVSEHPMETRRGAKHQ